MSERRFYTVYRTRNGRYGDLYNIINQRNLDREESVFLFCEDVVYNGEIPLEGEYRVGDILDNIVSTRSAIINARKDTRRLSEYHAKFEESIKTLIKPRK